MTSCDRCQHKALVEKAKKICEACSGRCDSCSAGDRCQDREIVEKARACCLSCDPDALSHGGKSHVQATEFTLEQKKHIGQDPAPDVRETVDAVELQRLLRDLLEKADAPDGSALVFFSKSDFDPIREYLDTSKRDARSEVTDTVPAVAVEAMTRLLLELRTMDLNTVEVFHGLLNGARYSQIAKRLGICREGYDGRAAIGARVSSAFKRYPWFADFYRLMKPQIGGLKNKLARSRDWELLRQKRERNCVEYYRYSYKGTAMFHPLQEIEDGPEYGDRSDSLKQTDDPCDPLDEMLDADPPDVDLLDEQEQREADAEADRIADDPDNGVLD